MAKFTTYLECRHCVGKNCTDYLMKCDVLKVTKNNMAKVLIYGERNWKGREEITKIRYVSLDRIQRHEHESKE